MLQQPRRALLLICACALLPACGGGGGGGGGAAPAGPTPPLISSFTPAADVVGAAVQIEGLLFDPTAANNTVRFNGVTASVQSATASEIIAIVPAGALTGPIQVTTTGGSSTTLTNFTVLSDSTTPGVSWTTRLTGPRDGPSGIAWNGTRFISAGHSIQASTDLYRWDERRVFVTLSEVIWSGSLFVAVGSSGEIYSSPDGLTWTARVLSGNALYSVASSGSLWIAVGETGTVKTSPNAIDWTSRTPPTGQDLHGIAWNGVFFVAVGKAGTILTTIDGISWTPRSSGTVDNLFAVGATASLLVAAGSTALILTSPDAVTWTPRSSVAGTASSIIHADGRWVIASNFKVVTSPDGVSWGVSSTDVGLLGDVTHDGTQYVAVGDDSLGEAAVWSSPDATTWTLKSGEYGLTSLARSPGSGRLVAVGGSRRTFVSTNHGLTWQVGGLTAGPSFIAEVEWSAGLSAFVANGNGSVLTSADGLSWTSIGTLPLNGAIGASPSLLVNVGSNLSGNGISTSPDGVTWTPRTNPSPQLLRDVIWTGSQFVSVGAGGVIVTSPDGVTWTLRTSGVSAPLNGGTASPSVIVVVGDSGSLATSPDGITWTPRTSNTTFSLKKVAWTGAEFVAVGSSGRAIRSTDGVTWNVQATPYTSVLFGSDEFHLNDVIWSPGGTRLVVVGARGLIATSP